MAFGGIRSVERPAEDTANFLARKIMRNGGKNSKLGEGVYAFSLPHGKDWSCPEATELCESICYVDNYIMRRPRILKSYQENFEIAMRPDFGKILKLTLSLLPSCILRIHVSGDFFSITYIRAWASALKANEHVKPFGFTRSWRDPKKRKVMEQTGLNRVVLASVDDETGPAPEGWRPATITRAVRIREIRKGASIPALLCNEQHPRTNDTCGSCGRCPLVKQKIVDGLHTLVPLSPRAASAGVVFAEH